MKNLFSIEGKVALVTGGSRGIGLMIARGFVENGATVYIASRKADECEKVARELSAHGTCHALAADLGSVAGAKDLAARLAEKESVLHVLVNNAGANWGAPLAEYPDAAWDKVLALNVKGVFHLTVACLPLLETYAYSASKAALHHLSRVLAMKLAEKKITVNAVAPGP
ncbi:MAG: SDR family NAD(P)-dependent oxidoreductase, partial [Acidobacteriota bacterium]